jgi:hypothetical protein
VISIAELREVVPTIEGPEDLERPELFEGFASPVEDEPDDVEEMPVRDEPERTGDVPEPRGSHEAEQPPQPD